MAVGAASSAYDPRHGVPWKWLLLTLCALVFVVMITSVVDYLGFGGTPWFGWWEGAASQPTQPYTAAFGSLKPGGATAAAGIRSGDWIDLREQSADARFGLFAQPMAKRSITLVIHRGGHTFAIGVVPSATWEGGVGFKLWTLIPGWIASTLLVGCAFLIAIRRAWTPEGRMLSLILLLAAAPATSIVLPNTAATAFSPIVLYACVLTAFLLLIPLSSCFGVRTTWRVILESCAYGVFVLNAAELIAFAFGLFTLRIDPLKYVPNYTVGIYAAAGLSAALYVGLAVSVVVVAAAAVASSVRSERPRTAWLLLPLPLALLVAGGISSLQVSQTWAFVQTWAALEVLLMLSSCALLLGAMAVTYALLRRRVLDFGFVLSRTIVVAIVSLIVVASFILLEWMLGTVLVGVSHVTGLLANAALALFLGLSLSYIHKRVDAFIDALFFRKRRDNERSLCDFASEAAYVTDSNALLDQAIENIEHHTDARGAALLLDGGGAYTVARSFGNGIALDVSENDGAILALKTWHKPLDPHHYSTALQGALAFPMVGRGRLLGVLLLGERAGGEAYAPDEVEALSQFAHGVGSAIDALSRRSDTAVESLGERLDLIVKELRALPSKINEQLPPRSAP